MHDREFRLYETLRDFSTHIETFRGFLRLSNLKSFMETMKYFMEKMKWFMEKMKYYGQNEYFMDKMKYRLKV